LLYARGVSDLSNNASLLVAGLDLSLVRLLRQAIRTADLSAAASAGTGHAVVDRSRNQAAVRTVLKIEKEKVPAATFEPCAKNYAHPRLAELQPYTPSRPVLPVDSKFTIQAPWKVLPWPKPARPTLPPGQHVIKTNAHRADESSVGRMLDLFV
jgi:hypothetical protein